MPLVTFLSLVFATGLFSVLVGAANYWTITRHEVTTMDILVMAIRRRMYKWGYRPKSTRNVFYSPSLDMVWRYKDIVKNIHKEYPTIVHYSTGKRRDG